MNSDEISRGETARQGFCPLGAPRPGALPLGLSLTSASASLTSCWLGGGGRETVTWVWVSLDVLLLVKHPLHVLHAVVTCCTIYIVHPLIKS